MKGVFLVDTAAGERVERIDCNIEATNFSTGQTVILENYPIDTSVYLSDNNNVQLIDFSAERGFKVVPGNNKNIVECYRSSADDSGAKKAYQLLYAYKVRWEDWIQNTDIPNAFLDALELQNGLNNDWYQKSIISGWSVSYVARFKVIKNGETFNYLNSFPITIKDYEESNVWDGAITHFKEDAVTTLFTGTIDGIRRNGLMGTEKTIIQADFDLEDAGGDVGNASDYYGVIRIEEYQGAGLKQIRQLSTEWGSETDNILIPLTSETKCKISKISATKIRLECQVDQDRLDLNKSTYKTSARIACFNIDKGKYSSHYSLKYD
jgi:hypothetical protein